MNRKITRIILALLAGGMAWYGAFLFFFIYSGAQHILADPGIQSEKFIGVFITEPLPRVATEPNLLLCGIYMISSIGVLVFAFLSDKLKGGWFRKGITFGLLNWLMTIPWFEFYLPYNVMHEPLSLVLFEGLLWLGVLLTFASAVSFILHFRMKNPR
ncbi:MAG: transmembrane protein [Bacteroidetes bacterium]|nr:MAG: transmembrane protein [Bacteroidota bacterium]